METPEVLPAENEENDPKKTVSRPPKMAVEQEEDDEETPVKKDTTGDDDESGDDSDDDDDSEEDDSDDDDEDPDDDDDDGETGSGTSSGEEDENELIWLKKEEKNIKNQFLKPENIKPKIPKKEKIKGPEKIDRTPWQQMIDFLVHGAKGAMIKNGDISIKEQIADKLLLGLGFKSFKEDIMLQQQAKKYWTQKFSGQKADISLLNTDKITKKIKKEETVQQNKQIKNEQSRFLRRLIGNKNEKAEQIKTEQTKNFISKISVEKTDNRQLSQQHIQQQAAFEKTDKLTTGKTSAGRFSPSEFSAGGLKEKIGQAVQQTETASVAPSIKQSVPLPEQQAARPSKQPGQSTEYLALLQRENAFKPNEMPAEKPLTVAELKRQEKKEAEINPTVEQSVQKQQKQEQKDFHNMIMMQQMQLQNNMQNTMQSKLQNEIQQQALQQQMGFVAAARAGLQHFHHPHHRQPHDLPLNESLNKQPITPEQARSQFMEQQAAFSAASTVATAITKVNAQKTAQNNVSDVQSVAEGQSIQNPNIEAVNPDMPTHLGQNGQPFPRDGEEALQQNQFLQEQIIR